MSNNNNGSPQGGNPFAGGATYQSIIIALVAGGVLSTGLVTLVWRRRRYREMEREMDRAVRDGRERYRTRREREERDAAAGKGRRGGLGAAPQIWDAVVGEKAPLLSGPSESRRSADARRVSGNEGTDEEDDKAGHAESPMSDEDSGDIDVDGLMKEGWTPTSVSFLRTGQAGIQSRASYATSPTVAEVSVLIAMPSEDQYHPGYSLQQNGLSSAFPASGGLSPPMTPNTPLPAYFNPYTPGSARHQSSSEKASIPHGSTSYPLLHTSLPDTDVLPILQLATTCAPVSAGSMAEREELDRLVTEGENAQRRKAGTVVRAGDGWTGNTGGNETEAGQRRIERVDGFRREIA